MLVAQSNDFDASRIGTVLVAAITSNLTRSEAPGSVRLARKASKLKRDSVVNVSQVLTMDKSRLTERVTRLPDRTLFQADAGLRLVLSL